MLVFDSFAKLTKGLCCRKKLCVEQILQLLLQHHALLLMSFDVCVTLSLEQMKKVLIFFQ